MNRNTRQPVLAGFTLVELLVVIGIIALLVMILLPSFGRAKDAARRVGDKATIAGLDRACMVYAEENKGQYPVSAAWTFTGNTLDHHVIRNCSNGSTYKYGAGNPAYPGACLLFDRLTRNIDDYTGAPPITPQSKAAAYEVSNFKIAQMKHPDPVLAKQGVKADAYYFVDNFDNPILYYNFCLDPVADKTVTSPRYWDEHNISDPSNNFVRPLAMNVPPTSPLTTPPAPTVAPYSMRWRPIPPFSPTNPPGVYEYYRGATKSNNGANFILISPGKDHKYVPAEGYAPDFHSPNPSLYWDGATDDVTNFTSR